MEALLITITLASGAITVGLGVVVARMLRAERRRSDARVEALMQIAATDDEPVLDLHEPVAGVRGMFVEGEERSPWAARFAAAGACAALAVLIGGWFLSGSGTDTTASATEAAIHESTESAPLELLSLRHAFDGEGLTITGIVQNPRGGKPLANVTAMASLLRQDGALIGTGRAPLDFTQLRPGEESPFVVKLPSAAGVARYRVSFRDSSGSVIGHVDRRAPGAVARKE